MQGFGSEVLFHGGRRVPGFGLGEYIGSGQRFGLGQGSGEIQGGVNNLMSGNCPNGESAQQCITQGLSQYCPDQTTCAQAVTAFQSIGPAASSALIALSSGNTAAGIEQCLPLIGMAVSVSPAGPIAGAVVVGALDLAVGVLQALGLFNTTPPPAATCNYVIWPTTYTGPFGHEGVCFDNPVQSAGPVQPNGQPNPDWLTMEQFEAGYQGDPNNWVGSAQLGSVTATWRWVRGDLTIDNGNGMPMAGTFDSVVVPGGLLQSLYACGIPTYEMVGPPMSPQTLAPIINPAAFHAMLMGTQPSVQNGTPGVTAAFQGGAGALTMAIGGFISAFCQVFYRAFCERLINNHTPCDPQMLLESCVQAWNASHEGTAVYVFPTGTPNTPAYSFVESVIQGGVALPPPQYGQSPQGSAGWAQAINLGAVITTPPPPHVVFHGPGPGTVVHLGPTPPAAPATSVATKVVVGTALAAGVAAGGVAAYSAYQGESFMTTLKRLKFW